MPYWNDSTGWAALGEVEMDAEMRMPDLSTVTETVKVVRWLVDVGSPVRRGDHLLEVETDKAVMIVESTVSGTLKATAAECGEQVPAGKVIASFDVDQSTSAAPSTQPPLPSHAVENSVPSAPAVASATPARSGSFFARNRQANQGPSGEGSQ
jgi:pyruvate/2-oxoglutarate dehydrogenase complex dihydrolipoamide acyltransferase (E2) component